MTYALVLSDTIHATGPLPRAARRLSDGVWVSPPDGIWAPELAAVCGWLPVTETTRPADTDATTHDYSVTLVAGVPTETWTPRPWTPDELAARAEGTREQTLTDTLRAGIAAAVRRRQQLDAAADALAVDLAALSALNLAAFKALGNRVVSLARATALGQRDTIALARLVARALDTDTT